MGRKTNFGVFYSEYCCSGRENEDSRMLLKCAELSLAPREAFRNVQNHCWHPGKLSEMFRTTADTQGSFLKCSEPPLGASKGSEHFGRGVLIQR